MIRRSLWSPYVIGQTIIFFPCGFCLSFFFFSSPNLSDRRFDVLLYFHTWCGLSANLECMSEMCCKGSLKIQDAKKSPFWHHRTNLSGCIRTAEAYIDNRKKNLLNIDTSSTCPRNMVNFGPGEPKKKSPYDLC